MAAKIANMQEVAPELLVFYDRNAKIHSPEQVEALKRSIREFGFLTPCLIDKDMNLIAGHGRVMAAKELGMQTVPCVLIEDLTEEQRRAYIMADNRLADMAEWNMEIVFEELQDLAFEGFDVSVIGFDFDLSVDRDAGEEDPGDYFVDDPEASDFVEPGQIWTLGRHRLLCGDSTRKEDIGRLMDGSRAVMAFCDPPYGMKKQADGVNNDNLNYDDLLEFNKRWISIIFDAMTEVGSWYCWGTDEPLMDIYSNILKPMAKENKITFRNLITWDKGNGQGQLSKTFRMYPIADEKCLFVVCGSTDFVSGRDNNSWTQPIVEMLRKKAQSKGYSEKDLRKIAGLSEKGPDHFLDTRVFNFPSKKYYDLWFDDGGYHQLQNLYNELKQKHLDDRAYFNNTHDNMNNVWHFDRAGKDEREHTGGHATPKPIKLVTRALRSSSREGDIILDPFGGSGSTLIACEKENRICYMNEMDPHWCSVIVRRWEKLTGREAELINGD